MATRTGKQLRLPIGGDGGAIRKQQLSQFHEKMIATSSSYQSKQQFGIVHERSDLVGAKCRISTHLGELRRRRGPRQTFFVALCGLIMNIHANTYFKPASCFALKVTVSIPELVKLNDAFWLNCTHNNNNNIRSLNQLAGSQQHQQQQNNNSPPRPLDSAYQQIYSIKWYKDEEEFYSFLPGGDPRVSYYETKGVQPDKTKSFEGNVLLTKADLNTEGTYRCEILSEGPVFETVRKSKHLKVFALPVKSPRIEILDSNGKPKNPRAQEIAYEPGDKIELRCNSAPSKPAARLRWYLNDREVPIPGSHLTDRQGRILSNQQALGYNVNVTPVEHRVHYKSIQSSHSTLSLNLGQEDLVNGRISFKCLASIRQDIPIASKQLILLTPTQQHQQHSSGSSNTNSLILNRARLARSNQELVGTSIEPDMEARSSVGASIPKPRHRAQYNTRPSLRTAPQASMLQGGQAASRRMSAISDSELITSLADDSSNQMMYIYEDSDATFGPSIIDTPETLAAYLSSLGSSNETSRDSDGNNYALEFNRADNLEYVQQIRERLARQRSFPYGSSGGGGHKRMYGHHTLVKSPFYLDEHDPLRPVINWPPLDSGKLIVLPPTNSIVAVPTPSNTDPSKHPRGSAEIKFVMPPKPEAAATTIGSTNYLNNKYADEMLTNNNQQASPVEMSQVILERLIDSLNCTCSESNLDTRLKWIVNDRELIDQDVRHYPTRVSPDHRQTWMTIGLYPMGDITASQPKSTPNSLSSILAQYQRLLEAQARGAHGQAAALRSRPSGGDVGQQVPVGNEQLKFMCQVQHSMLLYSSSEMITFDFNPSANDLDGNRIDKVASLPSNVIGLASPTRSKSSAGWSSSIISMGSQKASTVLITILSISIYFMMSMHLQSIVRL
uniref:Ig-like domain-containing protein n=1 Tax=Aceria tosichella TaxID=561515 RepID=A0A6G1SN25_9ACAR